METRRPLPELVLVENLDTDAIHADKCGRAAARRSNSAGCSRSAEWWLCCLERARSGRRLSLSPGLRSSAPTPTRRLRWTTRASVGQSVPRRPLSLRAKRASRRARDREERDSSKASVWCHWAGCLLPHRSRRQRPRESCYGSASSKAARSAPTMRSRERRPSEGNVARRVSAPMLCLCKSRARRDLAARMLVLQGECGAGLTGGLLRREGACVARWFAMTTGS